MSELSPIAIETLRSVKKRANGWPCGIPADKRVAEPLVMKGYLEYAPPVFNYPSNPSTYRLTGAGEAFLKVNT